MALIRHKGFDYTVDTIADRNNLTAVDGSIVIVKDAIADIDAGQGKAIYRYDADDSTWVLITKSSEITMTFETEEIIIVNGEVTASNIPQDNKIWDINVIDGDNIIATVRLEDLTIAAGNISGLSAYDGKKLRFTYGYGSVTVQITAAVDGKSNVLEEVDFYATALQTTFPVTYEVGRVQVFLEGLKLKNEQFIATNGTSIDFSEGVDENTWIQVVKY